jgi:hypothetical protein
MIAVSADSRMILALTLCDFALILSDLKILTSAASILYSRQTALGLSRDFWVIWEGAFALDLPAPELTVQAA